MTRTMTFGAAMLSWLCATLTGVASASPVLRCQINQGGESRVMEFEPVADPYSVKPVTIGKSFLFKALVVGTPDDIDYINLYTYGRTDRGPAIIHETRYAHPQQPVEAATLTGWVSVYAPPLGRELQYACALIGGSK